MSPDRIATAGRSRYSLPNDALRSYALDSRCGDKAREKASRKVVNVEELVVPRDVDLTTSGRLAADVEGLRGVVSVAVAMMQELTSPDTALEYNK